MVPRVPHLNRRVLLAQRPDGLVREDDFTFDSQPIAEPGDGEVLVRTDWLGIDATVRTWLSKAAGYIEPVAIGDVVRGSRSAGRRVGKEWGSTGRYRGAA